MYSFSVILSELLSREACFEHLLLSATVTEIVNRIRSGNVPLTRPEFDAPDAPAELLPMMRHCWSEDPDERPTARDALSTLEYIMQRDDIPDNLTENLLQRMEQYANNLESIVDEKANAFFEEKALSERLLYSILPKSVADLLKSGSDVTPEAYDSVTIYFSDIVGFTSLSAISTPFEVVHLLNDLYNLFDGITSNYDAYKVETIGDAYMVVSGLPLRNGTEHVRQISLLALALMEALSMRFTIRHRPADERLNLRIGLHTGGVAAGVVGLVMPRYCLFGDTVNTASRMESTGEALRIHVSADTAALLRKDFDGQFELTERGTIFVKGKGDMLTCWLRAAI